LTTLLIVKDAKDGDFLELYGAAGGGTLGGGSLGGKETVPLRGTAVPILGTAGEGGRDADKLFRPLERWLSG
jgi:hypothetical protein